LPKLLSPHIRLNRLHYVGKRLFSVGCLYRISSVAEANAVCEGGDILNTNILLRGPGSIVGISDWLRTGLSGDRIPVEARFSALVQTGLGAHPASCIQWVPGLSRGYKERLGHDADHSPPSSAVAMKG
jgi:hypothetical protein